MHEFFIASFCLFMNKKFESLSSGLTARYNTYSLDSYTNVGKAASTAAAHRQQ